MTILHCDVSNMLSVVHPFDGWMMHRLIVRVCIRVLMPQLFVDPRGNLFGSFPKYMQITSSGVSASAS